MAGAVACGSWGVPREGRRRCGSSGDSHKNSGGLRELGGAAGRPAAAVLRCCVLLGGRLKSLISSASPSRFPIQSVLVLLRGG